MREGRRFLKARGLRAPAVVLFPGAGKPEKRWPLERFLGLARRLSRSHGVLLLTAPGEAGLEREARSAGASWGCIADLKVLGAVSRLAGAAVGNDSGPRHIAAASGARTLTLFGPEGLREWHPYAASEGHWAIPAPGGRLKDLSEDSVWRRTRAWLAEPRGRRP